MVGIRTRVIAAPSKNARLDCISCTGFDKIVSATSANVLLGISGHGKSTAGSSVLIAHLWARSYKTSIVHAIYPRDPVTDFRELPDPVRGFIVPIGELPDQARWLPDPIP